MPNPSTVVPTSVVSPSPLAPAAANAPPPPAPPAPAATSATLTVPSTATTATVPDLQQQYREKYARYDLLIQNALATNDASTLPQIRALNLELNEILEKMLNELNTAPGPLRIQKEELVTTLNRIQRDYNGLEDQSDTLVLLRRIREGETGGSNKEFQFYLGSFFVLCLGILAMIFFGGQMKLATATSPMTPASTAPLV